MALSREEILKKRIPKIESVNVEEWGGEVFVRVPSSSMLNDFESRTSKLRENGKHLVNFDARVAIMVCCDETGAPLFQPGDESSLSQQDALAIRKITKHVSPWLGWADADVEKEAKNSLTTQDEGSSTD